METKPDNAYIGLIHHWLVSERSSYATIAEWRNDRWYGVNEEGPISPEELARRGWDYYGPVDIPLSLLIHYAPYMLENFLDDHGLK